MAPGYCTRSFVAMTLADHTPPQPPILDYQDPFTVVAPGCNLPSNKLLTNAHWNPRRTQLPLPKNIGKLLQ